MRGAGSRGDIRNCRVVIKYHWVIENGYRCFHSYIELFFDNRNSNLFEHRDVPVIQVDPNCNIEQSRSKYPLL